MTSLNYSISISCIDTLHYTPSIKALEITKQTFNKIGLNVTNVYWFSDIECSQYPKSVWVRIPKIERYIRDYNHITLSLIPQICTEDYNFIIHADGFAVNPQAWTDEFFDYDYIGAGWMDGKVGNGGFTIRSKKLYNALLDIKPPYFFTSDDPNFYIIDDMGDRVVPEDNIICKIYKQQLESMGIRFAPIHIADRFSIEHRKQSNWVGKSLGFHGKHGISNHYGVTL